MPADPAPSGLPDHAELASLTTMLEDLTGRVTKLAEDYQGTPREDVAFDLFEVERLLRGASRRLSKVVRG